MAKKRRHFKRSFTVPVAVVLPVISPIFEGNVVQYAMAGNFNGAVDSLQKRYGFKDMNTSLNTYGKILLGLGIHWIASKAGLNRALGQAKVPIFRI